MQLDVVMCDLRVFSCVRDMDQTRRRCISKWNASSIYFVIRVPETMLRIDGLFSSGLLCVRLCCAHEYR